MKLENGIIQQNIKQVESQLAFAKNIFSRQENLWKDGIGSEVQFLSAKNNVESLEKQLSLVQEQLSTTNVVAEAPGVIDAITIKVGEKIDIRRFVKFNLGEGIEKKVDDFAAEVAAQVAAAKQAA